MPGMEELAHHIIAVANKSNIFVTNLQLQKVMYFTIKFALNKRVFNISQMRKIYNKKFLVWRYGPVVKDIYEEYKMYGADPIVQENKEIPMFMVFNKYIIHLLKTNPFYLVDKSHEEPHWANNEKYINGWRTNISYSLSDIKDE